MKRASTGTLIDPIKTSLWHWSRFVRPLTITFALISTLVTGFGAWEFLGIDSSPSFIPFAEVYYNKALNSKLPAEGIQYTQDSIRLAPKRAELYLLLAYEYIREDGSISPRSLDAIRQSYVISGFSLDATDYRLALVFSNWSFIPKDIRDSAISEARIYAQTERGQASLRSIVSNISDDNLRLRVALLIMGGQNYLDDQRREWHKRH